MSASDQEPTICPAPQRHKRPNVRHPVPHATQAGFYETNAFFTPGRMVILYKRKIMISISDL